MSDGYELEALDARPIDDIDSTGPRCQESHPDVGTCHRRFDHVTRGDGWHHSLTGYDPANGAATAQYWRWRRT